MERIASLLSTGTPASSPTNADGARCDRRLACPVCGGELFEIRSKRQCTRCHTICETCCEGGRG